MTAQRRLIEKYVQLDEDDVAWFNEHFPKASIAGTLALLFSKFREHSTFTPQHYATLAAKSLVEEARSQHSGD